MSKGIYVKIERIDPDAFSSYFLKIVIFKLLEKQHYFFWKNSFLTEVIQISFNDFFSFDKKFLASFFAKNLNLLKNVKNDKLRFVSIESAAVAKYPLSLLPRNFY